jgi:hypothetical protein
VVNAEGRGQKTEGRRQRAEGKRQRKEERDYPVGAAFSRDLDCDFYDFNGFNDFHG